MNCRAVLLSFLCTYLGYSSAPVLAANARFDDASLEQTNSLNVMDKSSPHLTVMHETPLFSAARSAKHFRVSLKQPHKVISTSRINGGEQTDIRHIVNFQSMEGSNHTARFEEILSLSKHDYHQQLADSLHLPAESLASMGTAANISNLVHRHAEFKQLRVDVFVTAGVKANALRSGDPANWYQTADGNRKVEAKTQRAPKRTSATAPASFVDDYGTINIIVLINHTLTSGALVKAAAVITEAKTAALNALAIPSRQSQFLATGTGTDQYAIAAPIDSKLTKLDSASGHLKLGELLGKSVREAVAQAIELQNGLSANATRNLMHALGRFGLDKDFMLSELKAQLDQQSYQLLADNVNSLMADSSLVAAAYVYATLLDRAKFGTFHESVKLDILLDYAAITAVAVSGNKSAWPNFRSQLSKTQQGQLSQEQALELFLKALAVGWQAKWAS